MTDKDPESPNPPPIIGASTRQSSKMELYKYHKTTGAWPRFTTCILNHGPARSSVIAVPPAESGRE